MANPTHMFTRQDCIWLKGDDHENLKAIQEFHPDNDKLALNLEESFSDLCLQIVSETLSHSLNRWTFTNLW